MDKLKIILSVIVVVIFCTAETLEKDISKLILEGAKKQLKTKALYVGDYRAIGYPNGDVPEKEGVCTDVLIRAYRNAGIDLQKLLHEDILANFKEYPMKFWNSKKADSNIDHRRIPHLVVFFKKFGKSLTLNTDKSSLGDWKPGDIVVYDENGNPWHCAIISDKRNSDGVPYIIDNFPEPGYTSETHLLTHYPDISGHFRYQ